MDPAHPRFAGAIQSDAAVLACRERGGACECSSEGPCRWQRAEAVPLELPDEETREVLTPTDAQLTAERLLGLTATIRRIAVGTWYARVADRDELNISICGGTLDEVFAFVRGKLGGAL
jgi:hypothetical protein